MFHRKDLDTKEIIRFDELRAQSELGQRVNAMKLEGYWYKIHCNLAPLRCPKKRTGHEVQILFDIVTLSKHLENKKNWSQQARHDIYQDVPNNRMCLRYKPHTRRVSWGHVLVSEQFYIWLGHLLWPNGVEEASKAKAWVLSCLHQWGQIVEREFWSGLGNISMLS